MRRIMTLGVAWMLSMLLIAPALAQDATPTSQEGGLSAADLGVGEIAITVFGNAFDAPAEVPAGRHLVSVTNRQADYAGASFLQPPADWTLEQTQEQMTLASSETAGPAELVWLFAIPVAGGAGANPGETAQAIVDLTPGRWVIWGDDPSSTLPLVEVMVTGDMPAELPEMPTDVTITAISTATGYDFAIDGTVVAGPQLVAFVNKTDQPHFISSMTTPGPLDDELFMALMMADESGTPPADLGFDPNEIGPGPETVATSAGVTIWQVMDFPAGYVTLACWIPDINNEGIPHAMEGMIEHIEVS